MVGTYFAQNDDGEKKESKPGILLVDEDPVWQKPVKEEQDSSDEEKPQVDEDIEVKRMRRLEQLGTGRPFGAISEDGSGCDSVSNAPNNMKPEHQNYDISPPRRSRLRNDTPSPRPEQQSDVSSDANFSPPRQYHKHYWGPPRNAKNERSGSIVSAMKSIHDLDDYDTVDPAPSVSDLSPPRKRRNESPILTTGERISKEEFLKSRKKEFRKEEKPKEIKLEWGKGLAQKWEAEARVQEIEKEKDKPFARSRDDPDLDAMLKERLRWGDPMAHLVKRKHLEPVLPDLGDNEKMKESGFIIPQDIPSHSWIRRGLDAAPNCYGIKPGRHWDGVDRSYGYDKELFKQMNEKRATVREAYGWS
ncbi:BUD13 homolog [Sesamum indicum]|uniref:BUD13 homolog n=1 Tax=Sesamum indicum TaxID=4182 RepID=A0A6I9UBQ0_SESIN|nr:BUD13 homolog [Sesamum indicum]